MSKRTSPSREQALRWLKHNIQHWPNDMAENIGKPLFVIWRFVRASQDGIVYFANCLDRGIGEVDMLNSRAAA